MKVIIFIICSYFFIMVFGGYISYLLKLYKEYIIKMYGYVFKPEYCNHRFHTLAIRHTITDHELMDYRHGTYEDNLKYLIECTKEMQYLSICESIRNLIKFEHKESRLSYHYDCSSELKVGK